MKKGIKIAVIGGGSSYTPEIIQGFIDRIKELPVKELWLVDTEEGREKLDIITSLSKRMLKRAGDPFEIYSTLNRREALKGADFVTTQLRVRLLEARIRDERIPLSQGMIGQETNGAGGFAKALRTIPVILDICKDMEELCPEAWLINFTNPSGMVTEAVLNNTNIKAVGLCNVPVGMKRWVSEILEVPKEDFIFHGSGLNHLIWGRHVYHNGVDRMPEVIEKFLNNSNSAEPKNIPDLQWDEKHILSLGMLPCPYHKYYYMTEDILKNDLISYKENGTRGEVVKKVEEELFEIYKNVNLNEKPEQLEKRGGAYYSEAACELINAIYNDKKSLMMVNTLNNGTIKELSNDSSIETTYLITKAGPLPLNVERFPTSAAGLLSTIKAFEKLTIKASIERDYGVALEALNLNPLVKSGRKARMILDEILDANKEFLREFK